MVVIMDLKKEFKIHFILLNWFRKSHTGKKFKLKINKTLQERYIAIEAGFIRIKCIFMGEKLFFYIDLINSKISTIKNTNAI